MRFLYVIIVIIFLFCYNLIRVVVLKTQEEIKKIISLLILALLVYLAITNFSFIIIVVEKIFNALFPFLLGIALAFILNIPMMKIESLIIKFQKNKKKKFKTRGISIFLSLIILFLIIAFILVELIPELVSNMELLIKNIPSIIKDLETWVLGLAKNYPEVQDKIKEVFYESTNIDNILKDLINYLVNGSISFITNLVSSLITVFTSLVFAIYMLSQKEYLLNGVKKIMKAYLKVDKTEKVFNIGRLANNIFSKFISGQCLEAVILGCIFFVILSIFKFPYALIISVLTSITALIPIFGAFIAMIVGAILIATQSFPRAIIFIILYLIIQQIEGNLIYPKVVGKSVGLSPLWTLLSITVGGNLFGIPGMLIGLPLASILYALFKKDVNNRIRSS